MKNYDQYKRLVKFTAAMIILSLQTAVFWVSWHGYYNNIILTPFFRRGSWLMITIYSLLIFFFSKIYGGYKVGYFKKVDVVFSQILGVVCANGIVYMQISLLSLKFINIIPMLIMTGLEIINIIIWVLITDKIFKRLYPPHRMLLLYGDIPADNLIQKMSSRSDKYEICAAMNVSKGLEAVKKVIDQFDAVIIWDIPSELRNPILKYCVSCSIRTYIMPKLTDLIIMHADNINLFDTPLLLTRNNGLTFDQKMFKRALDIILAIIVLIITAPIMLLTSIVIKLYDKGPAIYKQERLTLNGKVFHIYKFRSMIMDAEKDGVARLAEENDNRITPIGKIIRASRIDELPQVFNILAGQMSFVGPRPERPEITEEYLKEMPEFDYRLRVKAGLTGNAQVYGCYNTTPYDKLKLDISYIESYSFWLDVKLILLTIKIIFRKESTQGVQEGQITAKPTFGKKNKNTNNIEFIKDI